MSHHTAQRGVARESHVREPDSYHGDRITGFERLETCVALLHAGKRDTCFEAPPPAAWRADRQVDEERWLRDRAASGDPFAMQELGERLLDGNGVATAAHDGELWLRKACALSYPPAEAVLGTRLLQGHGLPASEAEGRRWLLAAAAQGHIQAACTLALNLLAGGDQQDADQAVSMLRSTAARGCGFAAAILVARDTSVARGDVRDSDTVVLLAIASAGRIANMARHASTLYSVSYAGSPAAQRRLRVLASHLFEMLYRHGDVDAGVNLAYVLRRGEIPAAGRPPLDELLIEPARRGHPFATVNLALDLTRRSSVDRWPEADQLMRTLRCDLRDVVDWWHQLATARDPEGDLVLGWLNRLGLAADPAHETVAARLSRARRGGWSVPIWFDQPAIAQTVRLG